MYIKMNVAMVAKALLLLAPFATLIWLSSFVFVNIGEYYYGVLSNALRWKIRCLRIRAI